jgi:hypothetical protein
MSEQRKISSIGRQFARACAGALLVSLGTAIHAETVTIPLGQQGKAWNIETPQTGMRKEQVEEKFGAPVEKSGPVGTPPIYTWDYNQFTVYFEGDYVIHSVAKVQPKADSGIAE